MKILIVSNGPTVPTGYGIQCRQLARQLRDAGHDVAVAATYGQQGAVGTWEGIRVYPSGYETNSNDILHLHALHHFDGDPLAGWIITILDVWGLVSPRLADFNVAAWTPVDHFPVPPDVLSFFARTQAQPVAMSRYGERLLFDAGLDPVYIPLSVDVEKFRPRPTLNVADKGEVTGRELYGLPPDAFVVGMVAMNKGWAIPRKGWHHAFWAFAQFHRRHPDSVLYVHAEKWGGAEGINLPELAVACGIPEHVLVWADQYAYRVGHTPEMMAAAYSTFDVLLAPSMGEGFCVPLIEAQACGTPVIVTDFSAQPELVGAGWKVGGEPWWDAAQHAALVSPSIAEIVGALEDAYVADRGAMVVPAVEFAAQYATERVFDDYWRPFLEQLERPGEKIRVARDPMPDTAAVAVLCPVLGRPHNVRPLIDSFRQTSPSGAAMLYLIANRDDTDEAAEIEAALADNDHDVRVIYTDGVSYAEKMNVGYQATVEPWLLLIGDDVRFRAGWLDAARPLTDEWDVIGTNDSPDGQGNHIVRSGSHADHFFVRRAYVEEHGSSLDGPGILTPECYGHYFVDWEITKLARARGVFTPCVDSLVEHLHPRLKGLPEDATYQLGASFWTEDQKTFLSRLPLIEMQRTSRGKTR